MAAALATTPTPHHTANALGEKTVKIGERIFRPGERSSLTASPFTGTPSIHKVNKDLVAPNTEVHMITTCKSPGSRTLRNTVCKEATTYDLDHFAAKMDPIRSAEDRIEHVKKIWPRSLFNHTCTPPHNTDD